MSTPRRDTRQRRAILALLEESSRPLTAAQIHAMAQERVPRLSAVTVYRVLHGLESDGLVGVVSVPNEVPHYEMAREHHHHFFCRLCRQIFDIPCDGHPPAPARPALFRVEEHQVLVLGRCLKCKPDI